ncbi:hypothetical protein RND81_06G145600 [Saponaria officinalis]|uniref:UBA domain-containing protein n=1 Tax=Saponaria officinalis TaxID=3572 RepID=A0AAW1KBS7_SAPOF
MAAKVKIAGVWTGTVEVNMEEWTVSMLREEVARHSNCDAASINLISCGRLLKNDHLQNPRLSDLGLRNNSKILATKISLNDQQLLLTEQHRSSRLARLKAAVTALAQRHADGSLPTEDYNIELEDQRGQKVNMGSETDQRAIMMGLMLHTKGKELITAQQFKDALEVLEMGEEAFSLCDQTLIERVDNVPILQIDMVWCYFMLRDLNLLSAAGERLARAKKGIERAHGKDGSRVRLLHTSRCPELALYLRLELLEGVAAFHCGQLEKSREALTSAKAKFSKLQVSDEALSLLISMGYKQQEATRALKLNEQDIESAVNFLEEEKEKKAKKRADDLKRQIEIGEQKKYGKTPLGKAVDLEKLDALVSISFEKELAAEALRRHENDALKALDDLTNPETKSKIQHDIESKKRKRQEGRLEAKISQLVSMGFDKARVTAALETHGTTAKALDELLAELGQDATPGVREYMRAALDPAAASSSGIGSREGVNSSDGENPSTSTADGINSPSSSHDDVDERDVEIEDELAHALGGKDAFSDYDIDITKEAEALNEYLALLDSALHVGKPSSL